MGNYNNKIVDLSDKKQLDAALQKYNNRSRGEKVCRLILESIFKVSFSSGYPDFLAYSGEKGGKKTNLEIDLYNEDLKLGVEYQGRQHYKHIKHFHSDTDKFLKSLDRDDFKRKGCYNSGVHLIEVPYFVKEEHLCKYIWDRIPQNLKKQVTDDYMSKLLKNKLFI